MLCLSLLGFFDAAPGWRRSAVADRLSAAPPGRLIQINDAPSARVTLRSETVRPLPRRTNVERAAASSDRPPPSAVLSRARQRHRCPDGGDGRFPDRHHALGRHAVLAAAQPSRADGPQVAEAAIRDRGGGGAHFCFFPPAFPFGGGGAAWAGRPCPV